MLDPWHGLAYNELSSQLIFTVCLKKPEDNMDRSVMVVGLGGLGRQVLQLLATKPEIDRIICAGRNEQFGTAFSHLVTAGAMAQGFDPVIEFVHLDLNNLEQVAETVQRVSPAVIFSTATHMSPWATARLPLEANMALYPAGFGVWLPVHLALTLNLMKALKLSDFKGITLTAPFPDVVNCMLGKIGLAPTSGIGNVDLFIPKVTRLASEELGVSAGEIAVQMVAHHALMPTVMGLGGEQAPPYHLAVACSGRDVTDTIQPDQLLTKPLPLIAGEETNFVTASSAARLILAFLSPTDTFLHAPAPLGLPGGYPVKVSSQGIEPAPIRGVSLAEAIDINIRSHPFDGVERIEDDGTAVFTDAAVSALNAVFNIQCDRLHPNDADHMAKALMEQFERVAH
jgi:hypothetical protein